MRTSKFTDAANGVDLAAIVGPHAEAVVRQGTSGNDRLRGTDGADTLNGLAGNDRLEGDKGDDVLNGGTGSDRLEGDKGNDRIDGGADADRIRGGDGSDRMTGGTGDDVFFFDNKDGTDTITDFTDGDRIRFQLDNADEGGPTQFSDLTITDTANGALVDYGQGSSILLSGVAAATVTEADFIFG